MAATVMSEQKRVCTYQPVGDGSGTGCQRLLLQMRGAIARHFAPVLGANLPVRVFKPTPKSRDSCPARYCMRFRTAL